MVDRDVLAGALLDVDVALAGVRGSDLRATATRLVDLVREFVEQAEPGTCPMCGCTDVQRTKARKGE